MHGAKYEVQNTKRNNDEVRTIVGGRTQQKHFLVRDVM